jgi:hypothetical protein
MLIQVAEEDGALKGDVFAFDSQEFRTIAIENIQRVADAGHDPAHFSLWEFDSETDAWTKLAPQGA